MQQTIWERLMWPVVLWGSSVLALIAVGMPSRLLIATAGFKF